MKIDEIFNGYQEDEELKEFNILHMYRDNMPCVFFNNGYVDMQNFELVAYNTDTMKSRNLGKHDALFPSEKCQVKAVGIFMDGSTIIKFRQMITYNGFLSQGQELVPAKQAN
jgi:hypothetical protein